jgi:hypothetical protein
MCLSVFHITYCATIIINIRVHLHWVAKRQTLSY